MMLRWVSENDIKAVYEALAAVKLHAPGAGTVVDLVSCPGTDTCKLGIASSRGLAAELRTTMLSRYETLDPAVRDLRIKVSGCFNSCGQHHISDLGFYGVSRNKDGYTVPHFQVILGGQWSENAGSFGLAIGAIPSKRIPVVVDRITNRFLAEREAGESFQKFTQRIGKAELKAMLEDLVAIPSHDEDASFYTDWGDAREYTIGDMGVGECAGEVVSPAEFALTAADREVFEAQLLMDRHEYDAAVRRAYGAMLQGARGLLIHQRVPVANDPDAIVGEFRTRFFDTEIFFDPFRGGSLAQYLFDIHDSLAKKPDGYHDEATHQFIEEAQLFLEGAQSCYTRLIGRASK
jgi:sulfite reductase (ferredoxin)